MAVETDRHESQDNQKTEKSMNTSSRFCLLQIIVIVALMTGCSPPSQSQTRSGQDGTNTATVNESSTFSFSQTNGLPGSLKHLAEVTSNGLAQWENKLTNELICAMDNSTKSGHFILPSQVRACGDFGSIVRIIDIKGALPLSCPTVLMTDQYYNVPIRNLSVFYYGLTSEKNWDSVPVIEESQVVAPEDTNWVNAAYSLTQDERGRELYNEIVGGKGFQSAEPVAVFYTTNSVFLAINFRWDGFFRMGEGQTLMFFEISRRFGKINGLYVVYDTSVTTKMQGDVMKSVLNHSEKDISTCAGAAAAWYMVIHGN